MGLGQWAMLSVEECVQRGFERSVRLRDMREKRHGGPKLLGIDGSEDVYGQFARMHVHKIGDLHEPGTKNRMSKVVRRVFGAVETEELRRL